MLAPLTLLVLGLIVPSPAPPTTTLTSTLSLLRLTIPSLLPSPSLLPPATPPTLELPALLPPPPPPATLVSPLPRRPQWRTTHDHIVFCQHAPHVPPGDIASRHIARNPGLIDWCQWQHIATIATLR